MCDWLVACAKLTHISVMEYVKWLYLWSGCISVHRIIVNTVKHLQSLTVLLQIEPWGDVLQVLVSYLVICWNLSCQQIVLCHNGYILFYSCRVFECYLLCHFAPYYSLHPPIWTPNFVKIWRGWRRSVPIVVCVITGACVCAVNTPRPPADVVEPSVCPRRSKPYTPLLSLFNKIL